ncbi:hypothetical protein [Streptomyces echinatus]|uniref:Uncharacterized protein n=1 Tax=Streptomyces echinatus TaxID=67293 RepID=A0A7W9PXA8_9ACTN|nr:hypothetical protein [Streptomyces echinatus]MBB5929693.1 hypothetical protein [Streptomyces echinatus]
MTGLLRGALPCIAVALPVAGLVRRYLFVLAGHVVGLFVPAAGSGSAADTPGGAVPRPRRDAAPARVRPVRPSA